MSYIIQQTPQLIFERRPHVRCYDWIGYPNVLILRDQRIKKDATTSTSLRLTRGLVSPAKLSFRSLLAVSLKTSGKRSPSRAHRRVRQISRPHLRLAPSGLRKIKICTCEDQIVYFGIGLIIVIARSLLSDAGDGHGRFVRNTCIYAYFVCASLSGPYPSDASEFLPNFQKFLTILKFL